MLLYYFEIDGNSTKGINKIIPFQDYIQTKKIFFLLIYRLKNILENIFRKFTLIWQKVSNI